MTAIVEGILKQKTIELLEAPIGLPEGHVRVIVITKEPPNAPACLLTFGKYQTGRMSNLEDFQVAQWRGEVEFGVQHGQ